METKLVDDPNQSIFYPDGPLCVITMTSAAGCRNGFHRPKLEQRGVEKQRMQKYSKDS